MRKAMTPHEKELLQQVREALEFYHADYKEQCDDVECNMCGYYAVAAKAIDVLDTLINAPTDTLRLPNDFSLMLVGQGGGGGNTPAGMGLVEKLEVLSPYKGEGLVDLEKVIIIVKEHMGMKDD